NTANALENNNEVSYPDCTKIEKIPTTEKAVALGHTIKDSLDRKGKVGSKIKGTGKSHLPYLQRMAVLDSHYERSVDVKKMFIPIVHPELESPDGYNFPRVDKKEDNTFRSFPDLDQKLAENQNFNVSFDKLVPEFDQEFI